MLLGACPKGLISIDQVSEPAGLIWVNDQGGWRVMKRSLYRPIDWSRAWSILYSMLINRVDQDAQRLIARQALENWLARKISNRELGRTVKNRMVQELSSLEAKVSDQAREINRLVVNIVNLINILRGYGVEPGLLVSPPEALDKGDAMESQYLFPGMGWTWNLERQLRAGLAISDGDGQANPVAQLQDLLAKLVDLRDQQRTGMYSLRDMIGAVEQALRSMC